MIENEQIEFKKTTSEINEAMISISSILNKHKSGAIYFGLRNDGTPFGFTINDSTLRDISRKVFESIRPQIFPTITVENIDGVDVIKCEFSGEDIPYSAHGRYYIRVADEDRELTPSELKRIMISNEYEEKWENKSSKSTIECVDEISLRKYYRDAVECGRMPELEYSKEVILDKLNLLNGNQLTNAGDMLFSSRKPVVLKMTVFASDKRITILDSYRAKGNIFELINEGSQFIVKNMRWRVEIDDESLQRKEIPEVPIQAIREAIMNSFAHARYDANVEHEIDIYSDRIAIINPGSFANEYTPEDFYRRDLKSYLRNKVIADVLYLCKNVETSGHGLKKLYSVCNEVGVRVTYENTETDFTIAFSRVDRNKDNGVLNGEINDERKLSNDEDTVLRAIRANCRISKQELIDITKKSSRTIDRVIASLKNKGLLVRDGSKKTGNWEVR